jgi:hypothetical protein
MSWKTLALVLAALCAVQTYRACSHAAPQRVVAQAECAPAPVSTHGSHTGFAASDEAAERAAARADEEPPPSAGPSFNGIKLPAWTLYFAPQPGESMLSYRDRMVPLAQAALAPHRARVARGLDDFAAKVKLDPQQRAQLDGAVQDAASAIQDKVMNSLLSGQLTPRTFKPMTGVTLARDVLDSIDKANQRFMASLREDQKASLAGHPFDFADYLLFSARWEDALGVTN